jgi:hypothetical protein
MIESCARFSGVAAAAGCPRVAGTGQAMTRQKERDAMADLIAIGYPDETTAFAAVLKTSLSKDDEKELQDALHGNPADTQ